MDMICRIILLKDNLQRGGSPRSVASERGWMVARVLSSRRSSVRSVVLGTIREEGGGGGQCAS